MDLVEKQIYQHLCGKFTLPIITEEKAEQYCQNHW